MAQDFYSITGMFSGVADIDTITVTGDGTKRDGVASTVPSGIFIYRTGEVVGSIKSAPTITLEGGSADFDGAVNQTAVAPYYTVAQKTALSSIINYVNQMSDAFVDTQGL